MSPSDFSTEEYECLGVLLLNYYAWSGGTIAELAERWLYGRVEYAVVELEMEQFMTLPLDQVPFYINDVSRAIRILSMWRLKIAR